MERGYITLVLGVGAIRAPNIIAPAPRLAPITKSIGKRHLVSPFFKDIEESIQLAFFQLVYVYTRFRRFFFSCEKVLRREQSLINLVVTLPPIVF